MNILEFPEEFDLKSGLGRTSARNTGMLHLSDVAHYIDHKMGLSKRNKSTNQWNMMAAAEVGFLWEDVLSLVLANRYAARIGEVELDGIVGSPDGVSDNDPLKVWPIVDEEYKATWRSINKDPESIWYWMCQFKSYCKMLGVRVTVLRVLYINGDYKGSGPLAKQFRLEFSEMELDENWAMILNHRDEMLRKGLYTFEEALGADDF